MPKKTKTANNQTAFIRKFSLPILPKGFTRIRHYGILSGTWKKKYLKDLLCGKKQQICKEKSKHKLCRYCKKGALSTICVYTN